MAEIITVPMPTLKAPMPTLNEWWEKTMGAPMTPEQLAEIERMSQAMQRWFASEEGKIALLKFKQMLSEPSPLQE